MKLQLVNFEQAKTLAELGFPQSEYGLHYKENGEPENGLTDLGEGIYFAPTLELVAKWLREEKNIAIDIHTYFSANTDKIHKYTFTTTNSIYVYNGESSIYEEVLSAGIDKAIEILKNKND